MNFDARQTRNDSHGWKLLIAAALAAGAVNASAAAGQSPTAARQPPAGIERLAWLHGCWSLTTAQREVEEYWMAPKGTSMLGIGRTTRGGVLADYEMTLIRQTEDRLVFEAHPANQPLLQRSLWSSSVFLAPKNNTNTEKEGDPKPGRPLARVNGKSGSSYTVL